ncbi:sarcosine oxidase subunit beta [Arthrobacter stackebrandtii]|uniref:Sarcosine oxidase subunit beta n=1 Tax=Arthrobacter stackebrandtii TaxID=272161 RepID=A0ABS4YWL4_9MICC|nr:FAD-binding oxidoreductase [Arthrobacter stackebrandtii]MBP2412827.1 sarcosine oxidase subunit beta [Arthrobacter stackebrandtii]PYH01352.1 FAD-dependent oxidoreductase [Arthrobacter stackebrandtii]
MSLPRFVDVVVIGGGAVGAACAYFAARSGLSVAVVERGAVASGTSSACEGNILVSDKEAGPELDLAQYSQGLWRGDLAEFGRLWEFEAKGGLVVSARPGTQENLALLAERQRAAGIDVELVAADGLAELEPQLNPNMAGGAYYPQDAQVQPMLAAAHLLRLARGFGATVHTQTTVTGFLRRGDAVTGVVTSGGTVSAPAVVNAAGTWGGAVAQLAGVNVPVLPRKGYVLVTEPLPIKVRHKVYAAEYVDNVASSDAGLQTSPVVEGTRGGTILIGSSRERVGFDKAVDPRVLAAMAGRAIGLFPFLAGAKALRSYFGFRPYCPDHLPVIGADPRAPGLWHACGHEGAGIGLSVGTGALLAAALTGTAPAMDLAPFAPERFDIPAAQEAAHA